jgi:catechol 2,3-dioxygenase-like lactoylglutathione lyase family enzyme
VSDDARTGGAAVVLGIHHFTIRCSNSELESLRDVYCDVLGMREGPRPNFDFPGHWLYVGDAALLHLAAILPDQASHSAERRMSGFDHVSLAGSQLDATRKLLADRGIAFEELPVPGWPLWQIFLRDPVASKIELTFDLSST